MDRRRSPRGSSRRSPGCAQRWCETLHLVLNGRGGAMRRAGALLLAGIMVGGLMAAASAQGKGGILWAGLDADPPNMDPHRSTAAVDRQVFQNLFDKLMDTDENLQVIPMLATSWTTSADG